MVAADAGRPAGDGLLPAAAGDHRSAATGGAAVIRLGMVQGRGTSEAQAAEDADGALIAWQEEHPGCAIAITGVQRVYDTLWEPRQDQPGAGRVTAKVVLS